MSYTAILNAYSLSELLEMNDLTDEDALQFMVEAKFVILPEILPVEFE